MCLIIDKPSGLRANQELLLQAMTNNRDGWGFMAAKDGRIHTAKGLRASKFWDAYERFADDETTIHFRLATHGSINIVNTHPFVICDGRYALMHNGMLKIERRNQKYSDTWHFAYEVVEPVLKARPGLFGTSTFLKGLEKAAGKGNRIVLLRADGEKMIANKGEGTTYEDMWLSNENSLPRRFSFSLHDFRWEEPQTLDELAGLNYQDIVDFCETDPYAVAALIQDHAYYMRRAGDCR